MSTKDRMLAQNERHDMTAISRQKFHLINLQVCGSEQRSLTGQPKILSFYSFEFMLMYTKFTSIFTQPRGASLCLVCGSNQVCGTSPLQADDFAKYRVFDHTRSTVAINLRNAFVAMRLKKDSFAHWKRTEFADYRMYRKVPFISVVGSVRLKVQTDVCRTSRLQQL